MKNNIILAAILALGTLMPFPAGAISIDLHVPEKYAVIDAGERMYFEVGVSYPENKSRKDLRFEYSLLEDGQVIAKSRFLKAVENQASFIDYIIVPANAKKGIHEISVKVTDYESLDKEVSATFQVVSQTNHAMLYFWILLGVILAIGTIIAFQLRKIEAAHHHKE